MNLPKLVALIQKLPESDKSALYEAIYTMVKKSSNNINDYIREIRERRFAIKPHCPYCGSPHIVGFGKYRGRQRYLCKDCGKTYNDLSASPMAGTHYPEKWPEFIELMLQGAVLRKVAEALDIHISTAFYWRHKVLNALSAFTPNNLKGIVESDEKLFLESNKGRNQVKRYGKRQARQRGGKASMRGISREQVCIIVAMDRNGEIVSKVTGRGRVSAKAIAAAIGPYIPEDAILCADAAKNYTLFAKERGLKHYKVNSSNGRHVIDKVYHIQHVNSYHSRLEEFINYHFKGVATKYLDKYLGWKRFIELHRGFDKVALKKDLLTLIFKPDCITTVEMLRAA
jgi:transposase-like protein